MSNLIKELKEKGKIKPPKWLDDNVIQLVLTGSTAYNASLEDSERVSDWDIYGICIPPKRIVFPTTAGFVPKFGNQGEVFDQWVQSHIKDEDAMGGKGREYDFQVYNIVKYFSLAMDNNPNIVDTLFVPQHCILQISSVGEYLRQNRHLFLSKKSFWTFIGYAHAQLKKMDIVEKESEYRQALIDQYGYDTKSGYHVVRLALEGEQILTEGTLELDRNGEFLKAVRRGKFTKDELIEWFKDREAQLRKLYDESTVIPHKADEEKLRTLLLECLEMHYGTLKDAIVDISKHERALQEIRQVLDKTGV